MIQVFVLFSLPTIVHSQKVASIWNAFLQTSWEAYRGEASAATDIQTRTSNRMCCSSSWCASFEEEPSRLPPTIGLSISWQRLVLLSAATTPPKYSATFEHSSSKSQTVTVRWRVSV